MKNDEQTNQKWKNEQTVSFWTKRWQNEANELNMQSKNQGKHGKWKNSTTKNESTIWIKELIMNQSWKINIWNGKQNEVEFEEECYKTIFQ